MSPTLLIAFAALPGLEAGPLRGQLFRQSEALPPGLLRAPRLVKPSRRRPSKPECST